MIFIKHTDVLEGRVIIVEIEGPLNSRTSPDFEEYINRLIEKNQCHILLDATNLKYISSEGIGLILFIQKKISEKNGAFIIFNLPVDIRSFYSLLGFNKILRIAESRIEALQIMDRQLELNDKNFQKNSSETSQKTISEKKELDLTGKDIKISEMIPDDSNTKKFTSFIVECSGCGALIRVKHSGDFLCPDCNREFTVSADRVISFH